MPNRPLPALALGLGPVNLAQPWHRPWRGRARAIWLMVWGKGGLIYDEWVAINLQYKHAQMLSLVWFRQQ